MWAPQGLGCLGAHEPVTQVLSRKQDGFLLEQVFEIPAHVTSGTLPRPTLWEESRVWGTNLHCHFTPIQRKRSFQGGRGMEGIPEHSLEDPP